jgi:hypothetical protein
MRNYVLRLGSPFARRLGEQGEIPAKGGKTSAADAGSEQNIRTAQIVFNACELLNEKYDKLPLTSLLKAVFYENNLPIK